MLCAAPSYVELRPESDVIITFFLLVLHISMIAAS